MECLKILKAHPKGLNNTLLTGNILYYIYIDLLSKQVFKTIKIRRHSLFIFIASVSDHSSSQTV